MEVWLRAYPVTGRVAPLARQAEDWGYTGLLLADSQSLSADIWVELALAAAATSRLRLGSGVTNPTTRHIAVTASAAATLQAESGGRVALGFAQGDSALSHIGRRHLPVAEFEHAVRALQGLLRGEEVMLENGTTTAIRWLRGLDVEKVPVHVAATGPRTIAAAARHAEGVDLTVGAELERLRAGVAAARAAAPSRIRVGAYLNVAVDEDPARARAVVRGTVAAFARFSAPQAQTGLSEVTRRGVAQAAASYDKERHAAGAQHLDDEFVDRFAVAGPAAEVHDRLRAIVDCGIDRLIIVPGSMDTEPETVLRYTERFARTVLRQLHPRP